MDIITFFERFTYPLYVLAIFAVVETVKLAWPIAKARPRLATFIIAFIGAIIQIAFIPSRTIDDWWKLVISFCVAVAFYDTIWVGLKDLVKTMQRRSQS
jgi:hypothetical protein